jgi:hypothetical protein
MIEQHALMTELPNETILLRYMDKSKFLSTLKHQALFFCRADKFVDPYEGSIPRPVAEYRREEYKRLDQMGGFDADKSLRDLQSTADYHKLLKAFTVVSCWKIATRITDKSWQMYLTDNESVAIQTTRESLQAALADAEEPIYCSKVRYIDYDKKSWYHPTEFPHDNFTPLIHKRKEFEKEEEFRLFHEIPEKLHQRNTVYWDNQPLSKGKFIKTDVRKLIQKVYFSPNADEKSKLELICDCEELGFNFDFEDGTLEEPVYY